MNDRSDEQPGADEVIDLAAEVGRTVLGPGAAAADGSSEPPLANFRALAAAGLLGLSVPRSAGGLGADPVTILRVHETLARYCAVTAFLFAQHSGECGRIAGGGREVAAEILPDLASGRCIAGIGASQLRRGGRPLLRAHAVEGGYRLEGEVPWASGYGLMTHLSLGAVVDGDGPLFFWVPFRPAAGLHFGPPMDLSVMRASCTVSVQCEDFFVPAVRIVGDDRKGAWTVQHGGALSTPAAFLLGVGSACLDHLAPRVERTASATQIARVADEALHLDRLRARYYAAMQRFQRRDGPQDGVLDDLLECRVTISRTVLRLAGLAVAAEGGTAHLRTNAAQRHLREAAFFCTVTVNPAVREAMVLGL